ncbi:MAG: DUF1585 domain-containing protein, partial [Bryobacterales bacterium]|nr:DUF1585 domain-containing protein [Bryobacterales bacterium]
GRQGRGLDDLLLYIQSHREQDFVDNLARKLLVYALGRGLQLSDEPLLGTMVNSFRTGGNRFQVLVEFIISSPQFRNQRVPEQLAIQSPVTRKPARKAE